MQAMTIPAIAPPDNGGGEDDEGMLTGAFVVGFAVGAADGTAEGGYCTSGAVVVTSSTTAALRTVTLAAVACFCKVAVNSDGAKEVNDVLTAAPILNTVSDTDSPAELGETSANLS